MKFSLSSALFAALFTTSALGVAVDIDLAARREPHYAEIVTPTDGSTVSITNGSGQLAFELLDGGQDGTTYTIDVYLGTKQLAKALPFNGYTVEKTFSISAADFPAGAYTLKADEIRIATGAVQDSVSVSVNVQVN